MLHQPKENALAYKFETLTRYASREEIEVKLAEANAELPARRRHVRLKVAVCALVFLIGSFFIIVDSHYGSPSGKHEVAVFGLSICLLSILIAGSLILVEQRVESELQQDLAVLTTRLRLLGPIATDGAKEQDNAGAYFDRLVDINLTNLSAYYGLVKLHANNGFLLATGAGAIGFTLLLVGLMVGYFGDPATTRDITYLAAGAGLLTEFISAVFFYIYNKTVSQLKDYHDSLLAVQNVLLSLKLVGDTEDAKQKATMVGQMLHYLVGKESSGNVGVAPSDAP